MDRFQSLIPALRLFGGSDSLRQLGRELDRIGSRKAVIVCGRSLAAHPTALARVREAIGHRWAGVFDGVQAHSPLPTVQEAAALLGRLEADAVIALGGGSAIVTARAAGILQAEHADARRLCTHRGPDGRLVSPKLEAPKLPQFVVPTTPTTACLTAGSAILDPADASRLALFDPKTRAQAVFVDPDLVSTAPDDLVLTASLNAFAMAVEGLESALANPVSDADQMHVLRSMRRHLRPAGETADTAARVELVLAAILCSRGASTAGGGLASALAHSTGARFNVSNGMADAVLLPHTMRFNLPVTGRSVSMIVDALGATATVSATAPERAVTAVERFLGGLRLPRRLRDLGIPRDGLGPIAEHAMLEFVLQKNPRPVTDVAELHEVLDRAW
jgi:alcohol dehydrogenase class IV